MKTLLLVLTSVLVLSACEKKAEDAPSLSSMTFSDVAETSFTVTWEAAVGGSDHEYKLVSSIGDNVTDATSAEENGTVVMNWTKGTLTTSVTGLSHSTNYYFALLVKNADGAVSYLGGTATTLCSGKAIYLATVSNGNFGGKGGADTVCTSQKPASVTGSVKAFLAEGANRASCYSSGNDNCGIIGTTGRADWPLAASTSYCTVDKTKQVGTTNGSANLSINANALSTTATVTYTGFNSAMGSSASNCSAWSSTSGTGIAGSAEGNGFFSKTIPSCATAGTIYCVQQ